MPQKNRLKKKSDFDRVFKRGKKVVSDSFNLFYLLRKKQTVPRFGVVVSKKTEKSAVKRNKTRRMFKEVLRKIIPDIVEMGVDMVFFSSEKTQGKESIRISNEVKATLKGQGLL